MVESTDINGKTSLQVWLDHQPREVAVWIASRAAARVLSLWWNAVLTEDWAHKHEWTALPVLRSLLTSSVAAQVPTDGIRSANAAASAAADAATPDFDATTTPAYYAAANAAETVANAANVAATAAKAADAAADALDPAADDAWSAVRTDAEQVVDGTFPDTLPLWPDGQGPLAQHWAGFKAKLAKSSDLPDWQFWIDWYDAQLSGRTMLPDPKRTWDMLEEIALIDSKTWDAGPETVNPEIRRIWEGYKNGAPASGRAADPEPVSEDAKSAMKQRVAVNRDALVVAGAGLIDQLGTFKEQVRGINHLEPEVRDEVLAFIDELSGKLSDLIHGLPANGTDVDDDQAGRLVLWLREYRGLLRQKLTYYGSAENMAAVTVPTGIILGATGIGAMLGMPVPGSIVGGLIVNQMKPGQAAKELTKPSSKDGDAQ